MGGKPAVKIRRYQEKLNGVKRKLKCERIGISQAERKKLNSELLYEKGFLEQRIQHLTQQEN